MMITLVLKVGNKFVHAQEIIDRFKQLSDPTIAAHSQGFFKTGPGQYAEGDQFLGIRVPILRKNLKTYRHLTPKETEQLLQCQFHEVRLFALLLLVDQFGRGSEELQTEIYQLYLRNTHYINNWDLVDSSAHHIVGAYLEHRDQKILLELSQSRSLWERRIAIISTFWLIKKSDFTTTLEVAEKLLQDDHDLIHKAVGWMLREIGKRNLKVEQDFLRRHYHVMPRTMLRYAIERFPEELRQQYLKGQV